MIIIDCCFVLNDYRVWKRVPDLLQLLVCGGGRHEEAVAVAHRHPAEDPTPGNRGVHNWDDLQSTVRSFRFHVIEKCRLTSSNSDSKTE